MQRTQKVEYLYVLVQSVWDDQVNDSKLMPDLNPYAKEGWVIYKIFPREKDFFDIFFERQILPDVREKIRTRPRDGDDRL